MALSSPRSPRSLTTSGSAEVLVPKNTSEDNQRHANSPRSEASYHTILPDAHKPAAEMESGQRDSKAKPLVQNNFVIDRADDGGPYGHHGAVDEQCKLLDTRDLEDLVPSKETQDMLLKHAETGASLAAHYGHRGLETATHFGTQGVAAAANLGTQGVVAFQDYVQQGPRAVANICLCGGVSVSLLGLSYLAGLSGVIYNPFGYLLHMYMFLFGVATVILEADVDRIADTKLHTAVPHIHWAQGWLHSKVQFLTELNGRGLFYIYQGTLMATQDCFWCLLFWMGMYNIFMGALYLAMAAGYVAGAHPTEKIVDDQSSEDEESSPKLAVSEQDFLNAEAEYKKALKGKAFKGKVQFELYALLQQATAGDCTTRRPTGILNSGAKARWDAWASLRGMQQLAAKRAFVERIRFHVLKDAVLE